MEFFYLTVGVASTLHYIVILALSVGTASAKRDLFVAMYRGGPSSATLANAIKDYVHIDLQYFDTAQILTPTSYRHTASRHQCTMLSSDQ